MSTGRVIAALVVAALLAGGLYIGYEIYTELKPIEAAYTTITGVSKLATNVFNIQGSSAPK